MSPGRAPKKDSIITDLIKYGKDIGKATDITKVTETRKMFKAVDHNEQFITEIDLSSYQICWNYGINKWLGYEVPENSSLDMDFIFEKVHPVLRYWYKMYVNAATLVFTQMPTAFRESLFVINVPIQHSDGRYLLFKQTSMPFAYNEKKKPVSFLNWYFTVGSYDGAPLQFRLELGSKAIEDTTLTKIENHIRLNVELPKKRLTENHLDMIDALNELRLQGQEVNLENLVKSFKAGKKKEIADDTARRTLSRIKERLTEILDIDSLVGKENSELKTKYLPDYKDAFRIIEFCEQSGIINVLRPHKRKRYRP